MENELNDDDKAAGEQLENGKKELAKPGREETPSILVPIKEFRKPISRHVLDIKEDFIAPAIGDVHEIEAHIYDDATGNYYGKYHRWAMPGQVIRDPIHLWYELGPRKVGANYLHYQYRVNDWWSGWFDSGSFFLMEPPVISSEKFNVYTSSVVIIEGSAAPGAEVQLFLSTGEPCSSRIAVSDKGLFKIVTSFTEGIKLVYAKCTVNGYVNGIDSIFHPFAVMWSGPVITSVDSGRHPRISGEKAIYGAIVEVYIKNTNTKVLEVSDDDLDGRWSDTSDYVFEASGRYTLVARQRVYDILSVEGPNYDFVFLGPPNILKPLPSSIHDQSFLLEGNNGAPGARLEVLPPVGNTPLYGSGTVPAGNGAWSIPLTGVPSGKLSLVVEQTLNNVPSGRSQPLTLHIRPPALLIAGPPAASLQDTSFTLTGNGAVANATIKIFKDLAGNPPLISIPGAAAGDWSAALTGLDPGVLSLVAVQEGDGIPSTPSAARAFKIRPPKLTAPVVTYPTDTTVKFAGAGHDRATVQITVDSGPSATPPPSVVVANGKWETIATNWPVGTYALTIVQRLSDGAGGWIDSLPLQFTLNKALPDVSDLKHTVEYRPTFSGKGFNGATVHVRHPNSANLAAPTTVVSGNEWSTTASAIWGPSNNREVHVKQILDGQWSPTWCVLKVTVPPLAPGLNVPSEEGLSPVFSGTGWSGAEVHINFNGDSQTYKAPVVAEVWTFQRATPFIADTPHTIEVKQVAAELESPKAAKTFTVYPVVEQPVITYPLEGSEVPRDLSVTGSGGMAGATMRLWDDRYGKYLTPPQLLANDGEWVIALTELAFDEHVIRAEQTIYSRPFKRSEQRKFKAVVPPPEITCPNDGQRLPRTSKLTGKGMPHARVEVWMLGETSAPITEANVDGEGNWSAEVTLPVGDKTIWALQIYDDNGVPQTSRDSDQVTYQVVPKAPDIESPTTDEHAGRVLVVSGFGVAGDTVTVKVGTEQQSAPVKADRTWSVRLELGQPGGDSLLEVVSALDEFESEPAIRPIVLSTYAPTIELPAPGSWVANPVSLSGSGRQGIGEVVSWFDPDLVMTANIPVDPLVGWRAQAGSSLMTGGQWSRFRQSLNDVEKRSDWVDSERFEVEPGSSKLT
ncbi:hypothetical protein J3Q09_06575 [Pseudomonas sp. R4-83]|uniref:hypothetical protein n=1 Tax=unclassified Pseudomonas TaxID=196821 RepID=UPI003DAA0449